MELMKILQHFHHIGMKVSNSHISFDSLAVSCLTVIHWCENQLGWHLGSSIFNTIIPFNHHPTHSDD